MDAACHEEALANAHAITDLRRGNAKALIAAAESWMLTQPQGYRDFQQWLPPRFRMGREIAAESMSRVHALTMLLLDRSQPATFWKVLGDRFLFFRIGPRQSPSYIVMDVDVPWLRIAKPFPKQFGLQIYVYPNDHKPPHIHIDCPPGTQYTRYLWPELTPYPNDPRLRSSQEKALRRYIAAHGLAIEQKVASVPWKQSIRACSNVRLGNHWASSPLKNNCLP